MNNIIQKSIEQLIEDKVERILKEKLYDRLMSFREIHKEFGCSRSWIYRQHANGHLRIYKLGGKTRIKRSELEKLVVAI